jgi:hypothetical protein
MNKIKLTLILILLLMIAGCASASISMNDQDLLMESPKIVTKQGMYFIRFRYAESPSFVFYMMTWSKIRDNKLIFYIPVTSSSGDLRGVVQFEEIVSPKKIDLIKKDLVFWQEPDKKLIPLEIDTMKKSLDVINERIRKH